MPAFIHSIIAPNQAQAADGIVTIEMPVNPVSAIGIQLAPLNESSTITTFRLIAGLLSALDNVDILFQGIRVASLSGRDLFALNYLYRKLGLRQPNSVDTDNDRRSMTLWLPFGRKLYDPKECFPASMRGELTAQFTFDIADTGFDGLRWSVEAIELPDAQPDHFERVTTNVTTNAATGQFDMDLPIGEVIRAVLLFGTTGFAGATPAPSWGTVEVLKNNQNLYFTATDWEVLFSLAAAVGAPLPPDDEHIHGGNFTTTVQGDTQRQNDLFPTMENYALLNFDPLGDDSYSLDTAEAADLQVRGNAETADLVRIVTVQKFRTTSLPKRNRGALATL